MEQSIRLKLRFFRDCHPQWPILDPSIHTPAYVRARSAYLFTMILALGATSIAMFPTATDAQCQRAKRLHAHAEKLQLVLCATAAKSIEIVQAEQVRFPVDLADSRFSNAARCANPD